MLKRKKDGQFFVDNAGNVHKDKPGGPVVLGFKYRERGKKVSVVFDMTQGEPWILPVPNNGDRTWPPAYIRKDGWVTALKIPEKFKGRCEFIYRDKKGH